MIVLACFELFQLILFWKEEKESKGKNFKFLLLLTLTMIEVGKEIKVVTLKILLTLACNKNHPIRNVSYKQRL